LKILILVDLSNKKKKGVIDCIVKFVTLLSSYRRFEK